MNQEWAPITQLSTPVLQQNLQFLHHFQPETLSLIQSPTQLEPLEYTQQDNVISLRVQDDPPQYILDANSLQKDIEQLRQQIQTLQIQKGLLILFGNKGGYVLANVLPILRRYPKVKILVIEPSVSRLYACLALLDIREGIHCGRLHFAVHSMSLAETLRTIAELNLFNQEVHFFCAPEIEFPFDPNEFSQAYQDRSQEILAERQSVKIELQQQEKSTTIRRVFLLDTWSGAPGSLHLSALQRALENKGIKTQSLAINRYRLEAGKEDYQRLLLPRFIDSLSSFQPDMVISYGYHAPDMLQEEWVNASGAVWLQVVSNIAYHGTQYYAHEKTAVIEKGLIPYFQKRGAHDPFFVPIMSDYDTDDVPQSDRSRAIVFVGNSLALPPAEKTRLQSQWIDRPELFAYIQTAESDLGKFDLQYNLYDYMEQNPPPQIASEEDEYQVFRYLLCQGTARRRIELLERLAPLGLHLYGGDWQNALSADSPLRACLKGYLPMQKESELFKQGHVFINIHSVGHATGGNMRFFNVPGMGGLQITDGQGLRTYFVPGRESVFYDTIDEMEEQVKFYLAHPEDGEEIRQRGHERVRNEWSYRHWIERVFKHLQLSC